MPHDQVHLAKAKDIMIAYYKRKNGKGIRFTAHELRMLYLTVHDQLIMFRHCFLPHIQSGKQVCQVYLPSEQDDLPSDNLTESAIDMIIKYGTV